MSTWIFFLRGWLATQLLHITCTIMSPLKYRMILEDRRVKYFFYKEKTEKILGGIWAWDDRSIEKIPEMSRSMSKILVAQKWDDSDGPDSRISTVWLYLSMSNPAEIHAIRAGRVSCLLPPWFQTKLNSEIRLKPVQLHSVLVTVYLHHQRGDVPFVLIG